MYRNVTYRIVSVKRDACTLLFGDLTSCIPSAGHLRLLDGMVPPYTISGPSDEVWFNIGGFLQIGDPKRIGTNLVQLATNNPNNQ